MQAILIDAYRNKDEIILWLKTPEENIRITRTFPVHACIKDEPTARQILQNAKIAYQVLERADYQDKPIPVLQVTIQKISNYERFVRWIEQEGHHRLTLYDADIPPEQAFLYTHDLRPFQLVEINEGVIHARVQEVQTSLERVHLEVIPFRDIRSTPDTPIMQIILDNQVLKGSERQVLQDFTRIFTHKDPDLISMPDAFRLLSYLASRLELHKITCPLHRWDAIPIKYKGGKTFFSYGRVFYRDYAIRLNGRFLLDTTSAVSTACDIEAIIELSHLSGTRFQQIASRSFGSVFQSALVRLMYQRGILIPHKEKPVDQPLSLFQLLKMDRVGHTFDPLVGFHTEVAEIDFSSLFPWIIYNYNVSAETLLGGDPPYQEVPGLPVKISLAKKGLVPLAIKPMLDRRMEYKRNPTALNRARLQGLKWVLVTSYGYLRFREFKLGIATSHMVIGAFAREILLKAKEICEAHGYRIIHGIIDSLYIQKKGITETDVRAICSEIEEAIGIPIAYEGIFKWIVFLPSVNEDLRPVPTHYYGTFTHGEIKVRGLETRQSGTPRLVRWFQEQAIMMLSTCTTENDVHARIPLMYAFLREVIKNIRYASPEALISQMRISKTEYSTNIPQKRVLTQLKARGVTLQPGMQINYIHSKQGPITIEEYDASPDVKIYKKLLIRALYVLLQPFGITKDIIQNQLKSEWQKSIADFNIACECAHIKQS